MYRKKESTNQAEQANATVDVPQTEGTNLQSRPNQHKQNQSKSKGRPQHQTKQAYRVKGAKIDDEEDKDFFVKQLLLI